MQPGTARSAAAGAEARSVQTRPPPAPGLPMARPARRPHRPYRLFGRNALLLAALIIVGQILGALVFYFFVQQPRTERYAAALAENAAAVAGALQALDGESRQRFVTAFNAGTEHQGNATAGPGRPLERLMLRQVSSQLALHGIEALWREDSGGTLYLRLRLDGEDYWLASRGPFRRQTIPGAALLAWTLGGALAVLGAFLIQRRLDRPLRALAAAARSLGEGHRPPPLAEEGPEEIRSVGRAFNQMNAALAEAERERVLMLAGVSHDLRTPLAKLRLAVELSGDTEAPGLAADMARHCRQIDAIIDQFLDFARSDDGEPPRRTDLQELLQAALAAAGGEAFRLEIQPGLPALMLRRQAMLRLLGNLLGNALHHGAPDFVLRASCEGGELRIAVLDRGAGIPPAEAEALMRPFARGSAARGGPPGAGLGLAIVDRIARLHGGSLALLPRDGGGLEARLSLPLERLDANGAQALDTATSR